MQHLTSSTVDQNKIKHSKTKKIKPIHFLIGFISISFISAFIIGGYFIGKNKNTNQQNISNETKEQININPVDFPGNPDNWTTYKFEPLNLEFKLPDELNEKGNWKIVELKGKDGTIICFSDKELKGNDKCEGKILVIGSASKNFSPTENPSFIDSQEFNINNESYSVKNLDNNFELKDEKFKSFKNSNGFEILKIVGSSSQATPEKGYLGAILNTNDQEYPAVIFQMKIGDDISEFEFDQILDNTKISK